MSALTRNEPAIAAQIERLALEARRIRSSIEHARTPADKRVLNRQLAEIEHQMRLLRDSLR